MRSITDQGVMMAIFIYSLPDELHHKSFIKKITNKLTRYHKRRVAMCEDSDRRVKKAIYTVWQRHANDKKEMSIGALIWLIHSRHKEDLKPYEFDVRAFENMNRYFKAQGAVMTTAKILTEIEEELYNGKS